MPTKLVALLLTAAAVPAAVRTSTQSGNWNATATWGGNTPPGIGDEAVINNHAVTVTASTTVGLSTPVNIVFSAGATCRLDNGTPGIGGTVLTGTGTTFLTQLRKGDQVSLNGGTSYSVINTVSSDTVASVYTPGNVAATTNCLYRKSSVFIEGTSGQVIINASQSLTVQGDLTMKNGTLTLNGGSVLTLDNSGAGAGNNPRLTPTAGGDLSFTSTIASNTACGARATIQGVSTMPAFIRENSTATAVDVRCTDLKWLAQPSTFTGWRTTPNLTRTVRFDDVTLDQVGNLSIVGGAVGANVIFNRVRLINPLTAAGTRYQQVQIDMAAGTVTGTRTFTDNVIYSPLADLNTTFETNAGGFTVTRNFFGRVRGPGSTTFTTWANNVSARGPTCVGAGAPFWSFTGTGGDIIADTYMHNWIGIRQDLECNFSMNNSLTTAAAAVVLFRNHTVDVVGPTNISLQNVYVGAHTNPSIFASEGLLVLPMSNGRTQNSVIGLGQTGTTYRISNSTILHNAYHTSGNTSGHYMGGIYAGHANMVDIYRYNFGWSPTTYTPISTETGGFQFSYTAGQASPANDLIVNAGFGPNAHYNASIGNWYTTAGAVGAAVLGYDRFRVTTAPSTAADVTLGTGTGDSRLNGPGFADPRRNMMTYDRLALNNTATAWANGVFYNVGDVVQASSGTFYEGEPITFECIVAHTSATGDPTTGNPTVAANWGDRWMPRSHRRLMEDTTRIPAFIQWVREGWSPQNQQLAVPAASTYMGAVPVRLMIAAIAQ